MMILTANEIAPGDVVDLPPHRSFLVETVEHVGATVRIRNLEGDRVTLFEKSFLEVKRDDHDLI